MERKVVITKRFRNNTLNVYNYLLKEHNAKIAFSFLEKIEKRIDFITSNPATGKPSRKKENIRSVLLLPHNRIYYRLTNTKIEILSLFDMRKSPAKNPY